MAPTLPHCVWLVPPMGVELIRGVQALRLL
jgi:hypothetical protein